MRISAAALEADAKGLAFFSKKLLLRRELQKGLHVFCPELVLMWWWFGVGLVRTRVMSLAHIQNMFSLCARPEFGQMLLCGITVRAHGEIHKTVRLSEDMRRIWQGMCAAA